MAFRFIEAGDALVYAERVSPAVRLFMVVIGLAMLLVPLPFARHADWSGVSASAAVAVLVSVVALAVCIGMLLAAAAGSRELRFERRGRRIVQTVRRPLRPARQAQHAFADVQAVDVHEERIPDSTPNYSLHLRLADGQALDLGAYHHREPAEQQARELRRVLGLAGVRGVVRGVVQ